MRLTDRYYNKIYKETSKLTKKLFGKNITDCLVERYELKTFFEKTICKPIDEITGQDIQSVRNILKAENKPNDLLFQWAKYKTLCKILDIVETTNTLKTFTIQGYEDEC